MSMGSDDKVVLTVVEAGRLCRISRQSAYEAARRGDIPTIKIGRRLLVPRRRLMEMLNGAGQPAAPLWDTAE